MQITNSTNSYLTSEVNSTKLAAATITADKQSTAEETVSKSFDTFEYSTPNADMGTTYSAKDFTNIKENDGALNAATYSASNSTSTSYDISDFPVAENLPYTLAAKNAGLATDADGMPIINSAADSQAYQQALAAIRNVSVDLGCDERYRYSQTDNSYGYTNAIDSCATYALATTLSIINDRLIEPDDIYTNSSTDGQNTQWFKHDAIREYCSESEATLYIDAQLSLGRPALVYTTGYGASGAPSEHWATVIGKQDGKYIIIDPYNGNKCSIDEMQIYKNDGAVAGYAMIWGE